MSAPMEVETVLDGNSVVAEVGYAMSDMCFLFPITPSSSMGEKADDLSAAGKKNIFGNVVPITQMQSEGGVSGALHGAVLGGSLCCTFTCSQGLLLMIPEMYKMGGEMVPAVIHISSRSVGGQGMNINSDHSDVLATRQAGWAILCSNSVQQAADLAAVAHASTIQARIPFTHFFDGFRVSHELQKIKLPQNALLEKMMDKEAIKRWRQSQPLRNNEPTMRALVDGIDEYFPLLETTNKAYEDLIPIVKANLARYAELTGREYHIFDYFGRKDAEYVVVALGTACMTFQEYIEQEHIANGEDTKFGLIAVHLYHPFSIKDFVDLIPATCKHITIMDRTKEAGATGEPLYLECLAALQQSGRLYNEQTHTMLKVSACRYGLGGRDITPTIAYAVYENMANTQKLPNFESRVRFTVGINDDVTHLSIPMPAKKVMVRNPGVHQALFYGFGADGTVGAIKDAIKIIGQHTSLYSQAHFVYDAKKSGGVTISHVRFGPNPIKSQYEIQECDYLACHHPSYLRKYNMIQFAKEGATFVMNGSFTNVEDLAHALPGQAKRMIAEKNLKVYVINAEKIARECGLPGRINNVLQTVFFYLSGVIQPMETAIQYQKDAIKKTYLRKGMEVVEKNWKCVDESCANIVPITVPTEEWLKCTDETIPVFPANRTEFFADIAGPMLALRGQELKVSDFMPYVGGILPTDTAKYEKRGVAAIIPTWDSSKCTQCNRCSFVCPHAVIRPFILNDEEAAKCEGLPVLNAKTLPKTAPAGLKFTLGISVDDCLGCGSCADQCPVKALSMVPYVAENSRTTQEQFNYLFTLPDRSNLAYNEAELEKAAREQAGDDATKNIRAMMPAPTPISVQFRQPLLEFSAACAGCAEAPIARLVTQMFGERLVIANSCGCSMVWGGTAPTCGYARHNESHLGPTYTGALFEDTAEMGIGIASSGMNVRSQLRNFVTKAVEEAKEGENSIVTADMANAMKEWDRTFEDVCASRAHGESVVKMMEALPAEVREHHPVLSEIWSRRDQFTKKSYWVFGGDGWAYDIDFGGLDHVLHMGINVNILVLDTEVYSNTGGQKSKATPLGAVARFAAGGKSTKKKDLGMYAVNIGDVYVASVAQGANPAQLVKALHEAEAYPGTSLVIALCPCIAWGVKAGQGKSIAEEDRAVKAGYWPLYRYNPALKAEGKNPFHLDSPAPSLKVAEFLGGENRFIQLHAKDPERAKNVQEEMQKEVDERYARLKAMSDAK